MSDAAKLDRLRAIAAQAVEKCKRDMPIERLIVHHDDPIDEDHAWQVSIHEMIVFRLRADDLHALLTAYEAYEVFAGLVTATDWDEDFAPLCAWLRAKYPGQAGTMDTGPVVMSAGSFVWFGALIFGLPRSSLHAYYAKRELNTFDLWQFPVSCDELAARPSPGSDDPSPGMITERDIEPVLALVSEIEQTRLNAGWRADEHGEPIAHEPTGDELLAALDELYWAGRTIYDALAAKLGARTYDEFFNPRHHHHHDGPAADMQRSEAKGTVDEDLWADLADMKSNLATIAKDANRRPKPATNILPLHPREEPSDEFKLGLGRAFERLWPIWQDIERQLIQSGAITEPLPLTKDEFEAIPF